MKSSLFTLLGISTLSCAIAVPRPTSGSIVAPVPHIDTLPMPPANTSRIISTDEAHHVGPFHGQLTYFDPAVGACGISNTGKDPIAAISHLVFDAASKGPNPNANPLCGRKIRARRNKKTIDLTIVDRCVGCQEHDIDTTRTVFGGLAEMKDGRVGFEWEWL